MDYLRKVINNNSGVYLKYDYLMYPVSLNIVPKIMIGSETFFSKNNYHISLVCLENVPKIDQIKILDFAQKYKLNRGKVTNTYRLVTENTQQTIIVRVRVWGLKKLILAVNKNFGYQLKNPPTHITLFTLKGQTGIGIDTFKRYRQISKLISPSDIKRLEKSFKLI